LKSKVNKRTEIPKYLGSANLSYLAHVKLKFIYIFQDVSFFKSLFAGVLLSTCSLIQKGKSAPLQAWSGLEGSRKLRFSDFMTKAQDGGKFVSLKHRPPLPPGNTPGSHFC